jgi:poly(hydroxyalkanoate) granule-associated protein
MATRKATRGGSRPVKRRPRARRAAPESSALVDTVSQIWMAGLGALSRARTDGPAAFINLVQDGIEATGRGRAATRKVMRETVSSVQGSIESRVEDARARAALTLDGLEKMIQIRIHRALHQLGVPTTDEVTVLTRKVDELNRNVVRLVEGRRPIRGERGNGAVRRRARAKAKRAVK